MRRQEFRQIRDREDMARSFGLHPVQVSQLRRDGVSEAHRNGRALDAMQRHEIELCKTRCGYILLGVPVPDDVMRMHLAM